MTTPTPYEALNTCLRKAGTQQALAETLGCTQTAVWKMIQSAKRMSHQYVLAAEAAFGVSRHDLRPDIYPRSAMVDQGGAGRFYGIDRGTRERSAA